MACVAKATMAGLGGALIIAHLKIEFGVVGTELLFREGSFILFRHLRSKMWAVKFRMFLSLENKNKRVIGISFIMIEL